MSQHGKEPRPRDVHANEKDSAAPFPRPLLPDEGFSHRSDSECNLWAAEYESRMGAGVQQGLGEAPGLFNLRRKKKAQR